MFSRKSKLYSVSTYSESRFQLPSLASLFDLGRLQSKVIFSSPYFYIEVRNSWRDQWQLLRDHTKIEEVKVPLSSAYYSAVSKDAVEAYLVQKVHPPLEFPTHFDATNYLQWLRMGGERPKIGDR